MRIMKSMNEKQVYKTCLELKIEKLGYKEECYRTYKKNLKEFPDIKQIIKMDLFNDKIDVEECHVEAYVKIKKQNIKYINVALNKLENDLLKLKGVDN